MYNTDLVDIIGLKNKQILAIGAHPDDIELAAAGLLLKLKDSGFKLHYLVCSNGDMAGSGIKRLAELKKACKLMGVTSLKILDHKDGSISFDSRLVNSIELRIKELNPGIVLTHSAVDHHQDHINVSKSSMAALRRSTCSVITYPSGGSRLSEDCDLFVNIDKYITEKINILSVFKTQHGKNYISPDYIKLHAAYAGIFVQCNYAEKFQIQYMKI